jgi:hypothetical protein
VIRLPLLLAAALADSAPPPSRPPAPARERPRLILDIAVAAAGSAAVVLATPDIRGPLSRDARLSNVIENFASPVRQVRRGTRRDSDPFLVNYVAHPGLYALEALYLKRRGYGDGAAFLFTQVHSVLWEFAIEGAAFEPSGKDLLSDAAGAAAGIWLLRPVAARARERLREGRGGLHDHALKWLDPVAAIVPPQRRRAAKLRVRPLLRRHTLGLELRASF